MKDELSGNILHEFIGLKSKMYSLIVWQDKLNKSVIIKKVKGIKNASLKTITFEDYYNWLINNSSTNTI